VTKASGSCSACFRAICEGLAELSARFERARARRHELLLVDGVDQAEVGSQLLGLREPLLRAACPLPKHRERPGPVLGELVAQHRMVDIAEDGERFVDDVQAAPGSVRAISTMARTSCASAWRHPAATVARDADGLPSCCAGVFEAPDASKSDCEVSVRVIARVPRAGIADQGRRVVLGCRARIGEAHRQVSQGHRHGRPPRRRPRGRSATCSASRSACAAPSSRLQS
jgi:hypothetical protein